MTAEELEELTLSHKGWVHNPNVSPSKLKDSKTILNLINTITERQELLLSAKDTMESMGFEYLKDKNMDKWDLKMCREVIKLDVELAREWLKEYEEKKK